MISETEFAELGNSLSTGFFADNVVLVMARTKRLQKLQEGDFAIMKDASQLLGQVLAGETWLDNKRFSTDSAESALAFDRAVHAVPTIVASKRFVEYIGGLKRNVDRLINNETVNDEDIQDLRSFFFGFAKAVSTESQRVIDRSSEPQELGLWRQMRRETA